MKRVLIEGWRGLFQSLALVNQYQLAELSRLDGLCLRHHDLPFSNPRWNQQESDAGFPQDFMARIESIQPADGSETFDTVYRIAMPIGMSEVPAKRYLTFVVSEFALRRFQFAKDERLLERMCANDNLVITPSSWAKMKAIEFGFPEEKIRVVPHGVSSELFYPLSQAEIADFRGVVEGEKEEFIFLNISSLTREKGLAILVQAFAEVRKRHPQARLMLKDIRGLTGLQLDGYLEYHMQNISPLTEEVLTSIYLLPHSMSIGDMRMLYGASDCYVSPYQAEGFNLTVIEAIASGTPAIVTRGGATDDFCNGDIARMVEAVKVQNSDCADYFGGEILPGYHLNPMIDSLVEQMELAITDPMKNKQSFKQGRSRLVEKFSWTEAVRQLAALM